jgi:hypothetical protein
LQVSTEYLLLALTDTPSDNRALLVLSLQSNGLWAEGGKALGEGLKGNQVITGLNISDNNLGRDGSSGDPDTSGVTAIANAIPDMGAISQFTFSGDTKKRKPVTIETTMTVVDFSGNYLGVSGAIMLSAFLPKCM